MCKAFLNSQREWQQAQGLHRSKLVGGGAGRRHDFPSLTKKLPPTDDFTKERESHWVCIQTALKGRPHAQQKIVNTKLTHW